MTSLSLSLSHVCSSDGPQGQMAHLGVCVCFLCDHVSVCMFGGEKMDIALSIRETPLNYVHSLMQFIGHHEWALN